MIQFARLAFFIHVVVAVRTLTDVVLVVIRIIE
jgi:hypothetical protein